MGLLREKLSRMATNKLRTILTCGCILSLTACATIAESIELKDQSHGLTGAISVNPRNNHVMMRLFYSNGPDRYNCLRDEDFNGELSASLFKITDADGTILPYAGLLKSNLPPTEDGHFISILRRIIMVRYNSKIYADYDLTEYYKVESDKEYHLSFWLPVMECRIFDTLGMRSDEGILEFDAASRFMLIYDPEGPKDEYLNKLATMREISPVWAKYGSLARLELRFRAVK